MFTLRLYCVGFSRNETEWIELVNHGYNKIVGADYQKIINSVQYFESRNFYKETELYGGGNATKSIVSNIITHFSNL